MKMKPLVIYHANCADGFGAAYAAWTHFGPSAEYLPCQYGKQAAEFDVKQCVGRCVYIFDFSFPADKMAEIHSGCRHLTWLDHHKTAFEAANVPSDAPFRLEEAESYTLLHPEKSGAMLAWEYFHPGTEVPMFIHHIDDYDRWQFKIDGTKAFQKALWSYAPWSFEQWKSFQSRWTRTPLFDEPAYPTEHLSEFINEGRAILRAHDQNVQAVLKGAKRPCTIIGTFDAKIVGLACNCPSHLTSDVGHQLANESGSYGLCWYVNKDNLVICSLRSNGDYDVSAIAKEFGGGGHRNAAGFTTTIQSIMEWTK